MLFLQMRITICLRAYTAELDRMFALILLFLEQPVLELLG